MSNRISPLSDVHPQAQLADDVEIGPFCVIGPHVTLGEGCRLLSHVTLVGHTTIGQRNQFWPGCVIGAEPQDVSYFGAETEVEIGDGNIFREGVTVNRGADKEDGVTRIGSSNFLMANAHVAHNCSVQNNAILCNGVLLGGHSHVQDYAIISGNSVVHHFATVGKLAFVSGGCRVPQDVPPFMLSAGSDSPEIVTVNLIGLRRRGIPETTIQSIRQAFRMLYREHRQLGEVRQIFAQRHPGPLPLEVHTLLDFVEASGRGKNGRAREIIRSTPATTESQRRAA
ncbi:MAG TPA: acyl-ACP--UDP-N-acetylglucosamine O-acyltransferase [Planctomycetaceae bacterium]|nr:acyl-ACP--UDP-N-acetylglucosamine O-acyltransferase [Planctomycetaceae bacterium]